MHRLARILTAERPSIVDDRTNRLLGGRKFNAFELQLLILNLLHDEPAYGSQLMRRFSQLSGDFYVPSPGALYPALAQLEKKRFVASERDGKRRIYHLTQAGRMESGKQGEQTNLLLAIMRHAAKKMLWMEQSQKSLAAAVEATGWLPEFIEARQALQAALLTKSDPDPAEQRRIITILQQAVKDILNK